MSKGNNDNDKKEFKGLLYDLFVAGPTSEQSLHDQVNEVKLHSLRFLEDHGKIESKHSIYFFSSALDYAYKTAQGARSTSLNSNY
jgi:hypothetical protein